MKVTTELERKLLGAIGGFMALTSAHPELMGLVMRASELDKDEVESALKGDAGDRSNCTMWNLCNNAIGAAMLSHEEINEIREKRKKQPTGAYDATAKV